MQFAKLLVLPCILFVCLLWRGACMSQCVCEGQRTLVIVSSLFLSPGIKLRPSGLAASSFIHRGITAVHSFVSYNQKGRERDLKERLNDPHSSPTSKGTARTQGIVWSWPDICKGSSHHQRRTHWRRMEEFSIFLTAPFHRQLIVVPLSRIWCTFVFAVKSYPRNETQFLLLGASQQLLNEKNG